MVNFGSHGQNHERATGPTRTSTFYHRWLWLHTNCLIKGLFFDQTKWYSTQKKRLFQMAYFKFHEKNYWESSKLTDPKINLSRENHAHFISCKPPHKNHPREYFGTTLWFIQITTSVVEKSQISSVAFHLSTTVPGYRNHPLVPWYTIPSY